MALASSHVATQPATNLAAGPTLSALCLLPLALSLFPSRPPASRCHRLRPVADSLSPNLELDLLRVPRLQCECQGLKTQGVSGTHRLPLVRPIPTLSWLRGSHGPPLLPPKSPHELQGRFNSKKTIPDDCQVVNCSYCVTTPKCETSWWDLMPRVSSILHAAARISVLPDRH